MKGPRSRVQTAMTTSHVRGPVRWLHAALAIVPSLLFLTALHPTAADAQLIDCYKFDGTLAPNNTRCPGSNACCNPGAICLSNRLCVPHNDPNPNAKLVRGPCAVKGWDDSCPQICKYSKRLSCPQMTMPYSAANRILVRVQTRESCFREWEPARTAVSAVMTTRSAARGGWAFFWTRAGTWSTRDRRV